MTPHTIDRFLALGETSARKRTTYCEYPSCSQWTQGGKSYCTDHVTEHPYVKRVIGILNAREAEMDLVRRRGPSAVDVDGYIAKEISNYLLNVGHKSVARIARVLCHDKGILEMYVRAMAKAGIVTIGVTKRGGITAGI